MSREIDDFIYETSLAKAGEPMSPKLLSFLADNSFPSVSNTPTSVMSFLIGLNKELEKTEVLWEE